MNVRPLDSNVVSKIRSSFTIKSVPQCVTELVLNSLDAKSTAVAVRINLDTFKIQVVDDGKGISKENLAKIGHRYMTNKCRNLSDLRKNLKTYGFRGEAIASICKISKSVKIVSRERDSDRTYEKKIEGTESDVISANRRPSFGTTVTVEGFMNNLPVRQRCVNKTTELESVRANLESLIIINPQISVSLRDDCSSNRIVLSSKKRNQIIESFKDVHGDIDEDYRFTFLKVGKKAFKIEGLLCKSLHNNNKLQYVYVNQRPVNCPLILNLIRDFFAKFAPKNDGDFNKKNPIFVVNIKCPPCEVDVHLEPAKTLVMFKNFDIVAKCVRKLLANFFGVDQIEEKSKKAQNDENIPRSEFGVSRIFGAVKGIAKKRKTVEEINVTPEKLPKIEKVEGNNLTLTTNFPESEDSGKNFIMNLFLKSLDVFNSGKSENYDDDCDENNKNVTNFSMVAQKSTQYSRFVPKFDINLDKDEKVETEVDFTLFESPKSQIFTQKQQIIKNKDNEHLFPEFSKIREIPSKKLVVDYDSSELFGRNFLPMDQQNELFDSKKTNNFSNFRNENEVSQEFQNIQNSENNMWKKVSIGVQTGGQNLHPDEFLRPQSRDVIQRKSLQKFVSDYDYDYSNFDNVPDHIPQRHNNDFFVGNVLPVKPKKLFDSRKDNNYSNFYNENDFTFCLNDNANFTLIRPLKDVTTLTNTKLSPIGKNFRNGFFKIPNFDIDKDSKIQGNDPFGFDEKVVGKEEVCKADETVTSKYFVPKETNLNFFNFGARFIKEQSIEEEKLSHSPHFFPKGAKEIKPPDGDKEPPDTKLFKKPLNKFKNIKISQKLTKTANADETVSRFFNPTDLSKSSLELNISEIISRLDEETDKIEIIEDESQEDNSKLIVTIEDDSNEHYKENMIQNDINFENDLNKNLITLNTSKSLMFPSQIKSERINWVKKFNEFGVPIYLNTETGIGSMYSPKSGFTFGFSDRLECVPKGMSPILKKVEVEEISPKAKETLQNAIFESYNDELLLVKWKNCIGDKDPNLFFDEIYREKSKLIENSIPDLSKKGRRNLEGSTFTKDLFENLEIIGQVDCKFIAVFDKSRDLLLLFDQHAVHERVRLESLLENYDGVAADIDKTITMFLQNEDLNILKNHENYFTSLGLVYDFFSNGIIIFKVPLCLYNKSKKGFDLSSLVQTLFRQVMDSLKENNGVIVKYPQLIQNVINSEACRTAIKFGDKLSKSECCKHLEDLSKCVLPFQCAHGRPTLTPLISLQKDVQDFEVYSKPNIKKLSHKE